MDELPPAPVTGNNSSENDSVPVAPVPVAQVPGSTDSSALTVPGGEAAKTPLEGGRRRRKTSRKSKGGSKHSRR